MSIIPATTKGYLIVGTEFHLWNETSTGNFATDDELAWGIKTDLAADLVSGYCWNRFINARGYGVLTAYLKAADEIGPDDHVVINGWTFVKVGPPNQIAFESPPSPHLESPDSQWTKQSNWTEVRLDNLSANYPVVAHFETWDNAENRDGYGKIYLDTRPAVETNSDGKTIRNGTHVTGGYMSIGAAGSNHQYRARGWGYKITNPSTSELMIASCRTWPTKGLSYAGHDYHNAYGFANVQLAPS